MEVKLKIKGLNIIKIEVIEDTEGVPKSGAKDFYDEISANLSLIFTKEAL